MADETLFETNRRNSVPECVDLDLSEAQGTSAENVILVAELLCGQGKVISDKHTAYFHVRRLQIKLTVEGGRVESGTRLGLVDRTEPVKTETALKRTKTRGYEAKAAASANLAPSGSGGKISADVGGHTRLNEELTSKQSSVELSHCVTAHGGDTWDVVEPTAKHVLSGRYLGQAALCHIRKTTGVTSIRCTAAVRKADIVIDNINNNKTGSQRRLPIGKLKLIQILLAKSLGAEGDSAILSSAEMVFREL